MTLDEIRATLHHVKFRDWNFRYMPKGDGFLIQAVFHGPDSVTGKTALQKCRKWYVSSHATKQEVVRAAWKAVLAAVEHEAAEDFTYRGAAIFNPHIDPDALVEIHHKRQVRQEKK